ncbi:DeoR/GlpR family DNA-binding transcription regulator [Sphingomonas sp. R1]|uniref:DeoR/GlpR family DNA-binding transcription regulator n=1 Tax=Sphingomonas sp. R1 TaxID=399176 RepID=UPI0022241754|nr:DeoR/GlpR family DNA-binding transcription regulator [Sphingomonas sp. R1]UYY78562.1 DeoR/GlpR family DNA-binding transcription regulator [Sphingomonas sp. R1]
MERLESPARAAAGRASQNARLETLLALLEQRAHWSIAELAERFDVSEETIRRDVRQLEQAGRVQKIHGGVCLPGGTLEPPYRQRLREQAEAKQRIAECALALVRPGMTLMLDSGTTTLGLARLLAGMRDLTVITNSMEIAAEVLKHPGQRLFVAGGAVDPDYHAAFGSEPIDYCRQFAPDLTVLSMGAIDAARGFLDFDVGEAAFKRSLLPQARRVAVLCDATKFHKPGFVHVAGFGDVHDLVTDQAPPDDIAAAAAAAGTTVHLA